jgi:hypothetical protein
LPGGTLAHPARGRAGCTQRVCVGHLHITVDDLPWLWADFGQSNTIILAGMPRGQHKVLIEVVDAEGNVFTRETVTFDSPGKPGRPRRLGLAAWLIDHDDGGRFQIHPCAAGRPALLCLTTSTRIDAR